jgi:two-component system nitrate/nitrite response regulator NarL
MEQTGPVVRCVVVDDHEALRHGLVHVLSETEGIEVIGEADRGDTGLAMIERRRPDVAILDHHIPGLGGIELCRELTERKVPVASVIYTADADAALLQSGLEAGARGFLLKAGPVEELVRALRVVHEGRTYVESTLVTDLLLHRDAAARDVLSARETQVLRLLADGQTTDAAAQSLFLSPATVRSYVESAMQKLASRNRTHAVAAAIRAGYID